MKIINFRVSDEEHKLMHAIAEHEGLNLTAYIRRHFILQSRAIGLAPNPVQQTTAPLPSKQPVDEKILARDEFLRNNPMPNDGLDYMLIYINGAWAWEWQPPSDAEAFDPSA